MEFLVEFEVEVPADTPQAEVERRQRAESAAAAKLVEGSWGWRIVDELAPTTDDLVLRKFRYDSLLRDAAQTQLRLWRGPRSCSPAA